MKQTILLLLVFSLSLTTYSQDIEKMDKKELRIALKNSFSSKDSLISISRNRDKELALLNQNLIVNKDSIKAQKIKIASLLTSNRRNDESIKTLSKSISVLQDSILKLKMITSFVVSTFTLKALPKHCSMVYSETKELYQSKKFICYWGEFEYDNSLNININDEKNVLERIDTDNETDDYIYQNDKYRVRIGKRKSIFENDIISIIESAELSIKNLATGQEIIKKIYGEGGC
ncbi:hypothetical protein [Flavobacterium sp.]|uniref:hypothetical protein n=1 Tax=Flavobacterium sp. TaxID=239 RepID=UPI00263301D6|nr:hypothetical protein [Flavobacterium sp.]MDG2430936.1 hypothetical protein [Flavobacterium sp.]